MCICTSVHPFIRSSDHCVCCHRVQGTEEVTDSVALPFWILCRLALHSSTVKVCEFSGHEMGSLVRDFRWQNEDNVGAKAFATKIVFVTALRGDVSADVRHKCVCLALFLFVCVHLHGFATGIDCWCWRHAACIPPGTDSGVKRELSRIFSLSLCGAVLARRERSSVISVRRNWAKEVALADVRLARFAHTCARPGVCGGQ